ncbi:MAG: phosphate/phosphite/phosphonate ABC transporter substrate-binding protein [Deltaproteobacteria bacterium]|nr:phosphate/phosphite/phosphonate ABC transporter substrate-binding protein [Deltaproteobacteria bacterium]
MPGKSYHNCSMFFAVCLFFLLATGCGDQQQHEKKANEPPGAAQSQKLKIGLISEYDIFSQKKSYEPLAAYLAKKTGTTIELSMFSRYGNLIDNFAPNGLDGAFFGSFAAALAIRKLAIQPLARPEYPNGASTYHGLIFVRKDSPIREGADMRGKRFALVDKASTAGWLLPMHYFKENAIEDYRTFFSETYFTGTHEDAVYDVLHGKADIGAAKNTVFDHLAESDSKVREELQILEISPEMPANALAVRRDLDESLKQKLKNALLRMDQDPEGKTVLRAFGAGKFIAATPKDYDPVFDYADKIGLDPATYDYINE